MSLTNILRKASDSFADQTNQGSNFGAKTFLILNGDSGGATQRWAYLFFGGVPPAGTVVATATLDVYLRGAAWAGGPHTITAERILARWREDKINWNNKPAVSATNPGSAAVTGGVAGQKVSIDVTQLIRDAVAANLPFGIRLKVSTTGNKVLHSSEVGDQNFRPVLTVVWSSLPAEPTNLHPSGLGRVNLAKPVLGWTFADPDGDAQAQFRVLVDDNSDMATPYFDSGWIVSSDPFLDLNTTGIAAIPDAATRYWNVQVKDVDGNASPVSDTASFIRDIKGVLALTSPAATTETARPLVSWTLTGEVQDSYAWELLEKNGTGWTVRQPLVTVVGSVNNFRLPAGLIRKSNWDYRLRLYVTDDKQDRLLTPGDPIAAFLEHTFQFIDPVTNPGAPTGLVVAQVVGPYGDPGVLLTWSRTTAPNFWGLKVDGVFVFDDIDGTDLSTGGTNYAYTYYGAGPGKQHTYEVVAIVTVGGDDKPSKSNPTANLTTKVAGIWLIDEGETPIVKIFLGGQEDSELEIVEEGTTYQPLGRQRPVRITDTIGGYAGGIAGLALDRATHDAFLDLKERVGRTVRLVMGDLNIPVELGPSAVNPDAEAPGVWTIETNVFQVDEFDIEAS